MLEESISNNAGIALSEWNKLLKLSYKIKHILHFGDLNTYVQVNLTLEILISTFDFRCKIFF